jgi:SpoVK/Ycf46/Vps4 family AAA+-type ATPase
MPKIGDVVYLIELIGNKNYDRARTTVEQMIENERRNGREQAAKQLERSLRHWTSTKLAELPQSVKPLVWAEEPKFTLNELYLDEAVKNEVRLFIKERQSFEKLSDAGLPPRNRILLAGPPGNGKTSLAEALAKDLGLPFLSIKLHETIGAHIGETSTRLGRLFEYTFFNNCLIFLDELDCLGSTRILDGDGADKERNSMVNTLLTNLDRLPSESIVIGATNLPEEIDGALERRFNLKLWLDVPNTESINKYIVDYQRVHGVVFSDLFNNSEWTLDGQPWSRISEFCLNKHRCVVLGEENTHTGDWVGRKTCE